MIRAKSTLKGPGNIPKVDGQRVHDTNASISDSVIKRSAPKPLSLVSYSLVVTA